MKSFVFLASLLLAASTALAAPAEVLIIRHGEKTSNAENDKDPNLSDKGRQRAQALVKMFTTDSRMLDFGVPVAIYAGAPKKSTGSQRPLQTIEPTAHALNLSVNTSFTSEDFSSMVDAVLADASLDGKTVVICWPHDQIPEMAQAFGVKKKKASDWPGDIFDRVWKLTFKDGDVDSFEDLPQHVLPGDSQN